MRMIITGLNIQLRLFSDVYPSYLFSLACSTTGLNFDKTEGSTCVLRPITFIIIATDCYVVLAFKARTGDHRRNSYDCVTLGCKC